MSYTVVSVSKAQVSSKLSTKKKRKKKEEKTSTKQKKVRRICSPRHDLLEACESNFSNIKTLGHIPL